eukprot:8439104-Pyramimonas_sp.AAC.1
MQVGELETSAFPRLSSVTMAVPRQIACRGGMGSTVIDYFAVNDVPLRGYRGVEADMTWSKRPRRPVIVSIVDNGMEAQRSVYTATPTLPVDQIIGPRKQPTDWSTLRALAQACTGIANDDNCDVE